MRLIVSLAAATTLLLSTAGGTYAASAVQKECSTKYQAAKSGGTLNGMTYNQFYSQCAKEAKEEKTGAPAATPAAAPAPAPAPAPAAAPKTTAAAPAAAPTTAPATGGAAVFPTAISSEFSKESPGKARMHTCLAQYKTNGSSKGAGNAGLKWIEKGGGYYSECNKRLKG